AWAAEASRIRGKRFHALPASAQAFERGEELNEGLAHYVESRAAHRPDREAVPDSEFAAEDVRGRTYAAGEALALLLDRLSSGWREEMEAEKFTSLDGALQNALSATRPPELGFTPEERDAALRRARADVGSLRARRAQ